MAQFVSKGVPSHLQHPPRKTVSYELSAVLLPDLLKAVRRFAKRHDALIESVHIAQDDTETCWQATVICLAV